MILKSVRCFIATTFLILLFFINIYPASADFCCQFSNSCTMVEDGNEKSCLNASETGEVLKIYACKDNKKCELKSSDNASSNPSTGNYGLNDAAGAAGLKKSGSVAGLTGKIIGVVLSLVGIAFFLLMLYGGFLWMTARGDEAQAKKARDIIIDAVIGIIIVAAAGIITSFVFSNVVPK